MPPLNCAEAEILLRQIPNWLINGDCTTIGRSYTFANFAAALVFMDRVGALAEAEGHHPDLHLTNFKRLTVDLSTHAIKGLSINDFILAAKIDQLPT